MHLRFTQLLRYQLDGTRRRRRRGRAGGCRPTAPAGCSSPACFPAASVPRCRRGLVALCPARRARSIDAGAACRRRAVDLPDRFLTAARRSARPARRSPSPLALLAGPVALAQQALALASAGPGDVAVWLGGDPLARLGARVAAARGLKSLPAGRPRRPAAGAEGVTTAADPRRRCAEATAAAETPRRRPRRAHPAPPRRHPLRRRRLARRRPLAAAGGTLTAARPGPAAPPAPSQLPAELRLLRTGAYHPDLVPESLAMLRREPSFAQHLQADAPAATGWPERRPTEAHVT